MGYPQKFKNKREMLGQFGEYATFLRSLLLNTAGDHIKFKLKIEKKMHDPKYKQNHHN